MSSSCRSSPASGARRQHNPRRPAPGPHRRAVHVASRARIRAWRLARGLARSASLEVMDESLAGQLLLASPALRDPNFERTVVLIAMHGAEGAMGVVLNRPSDSTVASP